MTSIDLFKTITVQELIHLVKNAREIVLPIDPDRMLSEIQVTASDGTVTRILGSVTILNNTIAFVPSTVVTRSDVFTLQESTILVFEKIAEEEQHTSTGVRKRCILRFIKNVKRGRPSELSGELMLAHMRFITTGSDSELKKILEL